MDRQKLSELTVNRHDLSDTYRFFSNLFAGITKNCAKTTVDGTTYVSGKSKENSKKQINEQEHSKSHPNLTLV